MPSNFLQQVFPTATNENCCMSFVQKLKLFQVVLVVSVPLTVYMGIRGTVAPDPLAEAAGKYRLYLAMLQNLFTYSELCQGTWQRTASRHHISQLMIFKQRAYIKIGVSSSIYDNAKCNLPLFDPASFCRHLMVGECFWLGIHLHFRCLNQFSYC